MYYYNYNNKRWRPTLKRWRRKGLVDGSSWGSCGGAGSGVEVARVCMWIASGLHISDQRPSFPLMLRLQVHHSKETTAYHSRVVRPWQLIFPFYVLLAQYCEEISSSKKLEWRHKLWSLLLLLFGLRKDWNGRAGKGLDHSVFTMLGPFNFGQIMQRLSGKTKTRHSRHKLVRSSFFPQLLSKSIQRKVPMPLSYRASDPHISFLLPLTNKTWTLRPLRMIINFSVFVLIHLLEFTSFSYLLCLIFFFFCWFLILKVGFGYVF